MWVSGTGRCAFLRVGKGCYMAAALAAALCLVGGVALGQTKNSQEAFGQLTGHGGGGNRAASSDTGVVASVAHAFSKTRHFPAVENRAPTPQAECGR